METTRRTTMLGTVLYMLAVQISGQVTSDRNRTHEHIRCTSGTVTCTDYHWFPEVRHLPECNRGLRQYIISYFNRKCYNQAECFVPTERTGRLFANRCVGVSKWTAGVECACAEKTREPCDKIISTDDMQAGDVIASLSYPISDATLRSCSMKIGDRADADVFLTILDCEHVRVVLNGHNFCNESTELPLNVSIRSGSTLVYSFGTVHRYGGFLALYNGSITRTTEDGHTGQEEVHITDATLHVDTQENRGTRFGLVVGLTVLIILVLIIIVVLVIIKYRSVRGNKPQEEVTTSAPPNEYSNLCTNDSKAKDTGAHELQYAELDFMSPVDEEKSRKSAVKRKEEETTEYSTVMSRTARMSTDAAPTVDGGSNYE